MVSFSRKGSTAEVEAPQTQENVEPLAPPVTAAAAFPSVDLIPDEIAQEVRVRTAKLILAGVAGASLVVVGGLWFMASSDVSSAQSELDAATGQSAALSAEAAKYADVPKVQADLTSAQQQQAAAMGGEVRWSFVLNNLALTMPPGTSLSGFKGSVTGTAPAAAGASTAAAGAGTTSILGNPGVGSISFDGEATTDDKVAAFLEALGRTPGMVDPFATDATNETGSASSATGGSGSGQSDVKFTATTTLGPKALSHRYDVKGS